MRRFTTLSQTRRAMLWTSQESYHYSDESWHGIYFPFSFQQRRPKDSKSELEVTREAEVHGFMRPGDT